MRYVALTHMGDAPRRGIARMPVMGKDTDRFLPGRRSYPMARAGLLSIFVRIVVLAMVASCQGSLDAWAQAALGHNADDFLEGVPPGTEAWREHDCGRSGITPGCYMTNHGRVVQGIGALPNGHREYSYPMDDGCAVIFEIDQADIVVAYRASGVNCPPRE